MNEFNDFFDDPEERTTSRTPIYHTPDPPRRASKANIALTISIIIAVIMTLVVIVNVILLATLKDTIAKEYAESVARQTYDQYSEAVNDVLSGTDVIQDVTDSATQSVIDAMKSSIGEVAYGKIASVARIYMYNSASDSVSKAASMATAFLITDADEANPERYLVTNAHCAKHVVERTTGGGFFGGRVTYEWAEYGKIVAVFDGEENYYQLQIVAAGSYDDDNLEADNEQPDLALLKVVGTQPSNDAHPSLKIAASDYSRPGTPIALIGNPEGIGASNSISTGCISQTGIEIESWGPGKFILTDAALNSGNSGGPMLNRTGVVVGVAESKLVEESIDNMGFALSASTLCDFLKWASSASNNSAGKTLNINCSYVTATSEG